MSIQIVTAPTAAPLDLAEIKQTMRVPFADDDSILSAWLDSATDHCQLVTHKQLVVARVKQTLDGFPGGQVPGFTYGKSYTRPGNAIVLERGPVLQVVSIQYLDMGGILRTVGVDDDIQVVADLARDPARITPVFGQVWAIPMPQIASVTVTFDCGYVAPFTALQSGSPPALSGAISVQGWPALAANAPVRFSNSGGSLPAPLKAKTDYFVKSVLAPGVYTLSATAGGPMLTLTTLGSGTNYLGELPGNLHAWLKLRAGALNENREEIITGQITTVMPFADRLLDGATTWDL